MDSITLFTAPYRCKKENNIYPNAVTVTDIETFRAAVSFDHVAAEYSNHHRKTEYFITSDCIMLDVDNDSDNPADWTRAADVQAAFPGVPFYVCYSRNHNKAKDGKSPRPRFHVYFSVDAITDSGEYVQCKNALCAYFPVFDINAIDAARLFYGVENPQVEYFEGNITLADFMKTRQAVTIPAGERNSHMSHFAGCVLKRYGDTDEARGQFNEEAAKCTPLLENSELSAIWTSALGFFNNTVKQNPAYVAPECYTAGLSLKPQDYTDVGQASILAREYGVRLRHSPATNYLVYNGMVWEENSAKARGCLHELTQKQLDELTPALTAAIKANEAAKWDGEIMRNQAEKAHKAALHYQRFILKNRDSHTISGVMREAQTPLEIGIAELDKNAFLLNTPSGEVDLRTGGILQHNPDNYHTKITAIGVSDTGADVWRDFLQVITCGDMELETYLQHIAGQAAVGRVFAENLIIAYGTGRNGKSTFFNTLSRVLGDYSGQISAEILTTGRKTSKNWELADLRGKRLIVAPELEEGTRLDAAFVKKICSTDKIKGEKKYKDPFDFEPSHTVILFTNHLPRIGSTDTGTWRRLIVIPFNAVIEGKNDVKNYADYLLRHAGCAVLSWVIAGAQQYIKAGYRIEPPECVKRAIQQYRDANDWLSNYLSERCEIDEKSRQKSGELYEDYRAYSIASGEYTRSAADFKAAIEGAGYETRKTKNGAFTFGLHITAYTMPLYGEA
jgi:P4 family phage/plasmid primase-like protien